MGTGGDTNSPDTEGCGASEWPEANATTYNIDVAGAMREYVISIPADYDPNQQYRLVFAWHGLGGDATQIAQWGYYNLERLSGGSTIFVSGTGLPNQNGQNAWTDDDGGDVAFVRALLDWINANYCIDSARIFSVGMSYGGIMSNLVGCALGDVVRAIAPIAGGGPEGFFGPQVDPCVGQVAAWVGHGLIDETVTVDNGEASREYWLGVNGCSDATTPVPILEDPGDSSTCVAYEGCNDGYPVHWCQHPNGHTVESWMAAQIWDFFSQF